MVAFGGKSKEVNIYSTSTFDRVHTFDFQEEVGFLQFCPLPESPSLLLCVGISGKLSLPSFPAVSNRLLDASHEIRSLQLTDIILDVSLRCDRRGDVQRRAFLFLGFDVAEEERLPFPCE